MDDDEFEIKRRLVMIEAFRTVRRYGSEMVEDADIKISELLDEISELEDAPEPTP